MPANNSNKYLANAIKRKTTKRKKSKDQKKEALMWGGAEIGLHPKGKGVGGSLGYSHLLGTIPIPYGSIDIGGPEYGFMMGATPDPGSEFGLSPLLGARFGHPRRSGVTRQFPRGIPDVIYDKLRGRTKQDAINLSYPDLEEDRAERAAKKQEKADAKAEQAGEKPEKPEENEDGEKESGYKSELASHFMPTNFPFGILGGALAAPFTATQSYDDLAKREAKETIMSNLKTLLVPGVGPYQHWKRMGTSIRSPEVKGLQADYTQDRDKVKADENQENQKQLEETFGKKESGWKSEYLAALNPGNYMPGIGQLPSWIAAGATPTRTMGDQARNDVDNTWSNALIPFVGPYNQFKRYGTSVRSPEFLAMVQNHKDLLAKGETESVETEDKPEIKEENTEMSEDSKESADFSKIMPAGKPRPHNPETNVRRSVGGETLNYPKTRLTSTDERENYLRDRFRANKAYASRRGVPRHRTQYHYQGHNLGTPQGRQGLRYGNFLRDPKLRAQQKKRQLDYGHDDFINANKDKVPNKESALKGDQKKIDKNKNNKIDGQDLAILRKQETKVAILRAARSKQADEAGGLADLLRRGRDYVSNTAGQVRDYASNAAGQAQDYVTNAATKKKFQDILSNPTVQMGLGGGAIGLGAGGLAHMMRDKDDDRSLLGRMATYGTLGGITGAAAGEAHKYFNRPLPVDPTTGEPTNMTHNAFNASNVRPVGYDVGSTYRGLRDDAARAARRSAKAMEETFGGGNLSASTQRYDFLED